MTEATLVTVRFAESSKAFEALSALRQRDDRSELTVNQAVLVTRRADGTLELPDGQDNTTGGATLGGSAIGALLGLLGGPLGMLFGAGAGALIGGAYEADRDDLGGSALAAFSATVEPGTTALVADLIEASPTVVDSLMADLGGTVLRRPTDEVIAEVDAAEEAERAAAREADRVLRENRKADRRERREARKAEVKDRLASVGPDFPED